MKAENNKYEELWSKIKDIIRAISNCLHISKLNRFCNNKLNNSNNYDEYYLKIKVNSDGS